MEVRLATRTRTACDDAVIRILIAIDARTHRQRLQAQLNAKTKRNHEVGFRMVGGHVLKDSGKLGSVRLMSINTAVIDALYEKPLVIRETDSDGNRVERERCTTVNHAMKSCRRAWHIAARRNPGKVPYVNPFEAMGLQSSNRETLTATFGELESFQSKAIEMGLPSLALIGRE
jgi:hypothetical protein